MRQSDILKSPGVRHGFFGRAGGVSVGEYETLNTGPGSDDAPEAVSENRRRCAVALGVAPANLLTAHQVHSPDVIVMNGPWPGTPAKVDALVTKTPGLAVGALAADCMPVLFADPDARVIGAAHAGWRGALAGVLDNTVAEMITLGADVENIRAVIGPCLRAHSFEVGLEFVDAFNAVHDDAKRFFSPGVSAEKRQFDSAGYAAWRLRNNGVTKIDNIDICTVAASDAYFSYRVSKRNGNRDYGRNLSAIALTE
ncbi:MAG: peptidoglycan editing factor PgeF [Pseudomonadota bacterium]